ncbi:MAG: PIN domain nuclease [Anaerolineaceae bacterium]|nr:PIN domain nuclease [Anaerolineaceae bacterium]
MLTSRIIGLIFLGIIGAFLGTPLQALISQIWPQVSISTQWLSVIGAVFFAFLGYIITPWISVKPVHALRKLFSKTSANQLLGGVVGLIVGLVTSALLAYPLSLLPPPLGGTLPFVGVVFFCYLGIILFTTRQGDFVASLRGIFSKGGLRNLKDQNDGGRRILVDTSTIIDGRIADIAKTGFIPGTLLVPRFVLNELQYVSDSADAMRRQRGRRGMEILSELQKIEDLNVLISDIDVEGIREVDEKLVVLARQLRCSILTNDYNLNRIAEVQGVRVLNINELTNSVKAIILPGENFELKVIQEGKEPNQGVGYFDDGTMIVIENGQKYLNKTIKVTVTKVLQTSAGRMIFARPGTD